ncbi:permease [Cellulomonas hominis]|uniref:Permease n=1 Tax=Cellulomonas hominis TaxID=156981 RepID=A0A511F785_9CELL|nr:ABC transporter permease [Cellulomonas hominis]MBB5474154.1 putative ABC transport system permease protein [Cellulomonas hominis]NKY06210.1 ABC transporter permease [Cellulomonas hominis]NKY09865.1 ABC transporter permease [Cellulomonas hominis]GEL45053.1 permease [Cellulomonas hominis]
MKTPDLIASAVSNTFRAKTRTSLTILSIFIGAFTLTLTNGLGTGINSYIDDTVSGVGASDAMTVTKTSESSVDPFGGGGGPAEYDPDAVAAGIAGMTVTALTPQDVATIGSIEGVERVEAQRNLTPDFVQLGDGTRYVASVGSLVAGQTTLLAEGDEPDDASEDLQVALPQAYVEPLGLGSDSDAVGRTITIGITDALRTQHRVEATVVGVTEEALASPTGSSLLVNAALTDALFEAQSTGIPADEADRYSQAAVWFDPDATDAEIDALQDRLADAGFTGITIDDQLGMITTVIDGIVLVLNAFAVIALLAAAFGIVNTLFMSVQERTREIGLMKAMGMGSGRVFGLFSLEATFIGFLGSAIGAVLAIIAGTGISTVLGDTVLADLPGLTLIGFDAASIAGIVVLIMAIAFLAGTLPAARAARADPVESLRYE